jgi:HAE1 family hydrophobic/amphiphilic exporter-1
MSRFSIRNRRVILVICLALIVIGVKSFPRMPLDLFHSISLSGVVVATFYSGTPPRDIARAIVGGLSSPFLKTVFIVPAAYFLGYLRRTAPAE